MFKRNFLSIDQANLFLAAAILIAIWVATAYQPIVELHGFRQTQTAISVWAMAHGGHLLAYETPVLGTPWQMPFEFPAFQWIALLLWKVSGQPIEFSGRLASTVAALVAIWPVYRLARRISPEPAFASGLSAVILTAPVIAFWARSYMIETTALLFALAWLSLLLDTAERQAWHRAGAAILLGCLAAATKITTFAPFFGFGLLLVVWQSPPLQKPTGEQVRYWLTMLLLFILPLAAGLAWTAYSDQAKSTAPLAEHLMSANLRGWNLGTSADRLSDVLWKQMLWIRPLAVLGPALIALPIAVLATLWRSRRLFLLACSCICVYVGAFLVFPKLYRVHDYYQVAVAPFLCAAVVIALWSITGQTRRKYFLLGVLALQLSQVGYLFGSKYGELLAKDGWSSSLVRAGRFARSVTAENDGILVIGTGYSSAIPFYAERRAVTLPPWVTPAQLQELLAQPRTFFGKAPLNLAIYCTYTIDKFPPKQRQMIDVYFKGLEKIPGSRFGSCESYYPRGSSRPALVVAVPGGP
jgi:hypothetical protein